jgi:DNA-binding transcriptional LysR family regulator
LQDSTVVARGVGRIRHVVVASPALLRRLGTPKHPRELARLPCLRFSATEGGPWAFREAGRAFTVGVQGPLDCNLAAPMLEACAAGLGFVRCLSYQAAPLLAAKHLRIVLAAKSATPAASVRWPRTSASSSKWRLRGRALARQPDLPQRAAAAVAHEGFHRVDGR